MKFSFSTKGWHNYSFDDFCAIAKDLKFDGIELHNINNRLFTDKDGAFHDYTAAKTVRKLFEQKLTLACIDVVGDIATNSKEVLKETEKCIEIAKNLKISFIRLRAESSEDFEKANQKVIEFLEKALKIENI